MEQFFILNQTLLQPITIISNIVGKFFSEHSGEKRWHRLLLVAMDKETM